MEITLADLDEGVKASVLRFEGGTEFKRKMQNLNIRTGKTVRMVSRHPLGGPQCPHREQYRQLHIICASSHGVGNPDTGRPGGTGQVFADDIRVDKLE